MRQLEESFEQNKKQKTLEVDALKSQLRQLEEVTKAKIETFDSSLRLNARRQLSSTREINSLKQKLAQTTEDVGTINTQASRNFEQIKVLNKEILDQTISVQNQKNTIQKLETIVYNLAENDKERIKETKTWTGLLVDHDNKIKEVEEIVTNLGKNDFDRIEESANISSLLVKHDESIKELLKFRAETNLNNVIDMVNAHEQEIKRLENGSKQPAALMSVTKFALNSKGAFFSEIKKTLFFSPGLILSEDAILYSISVTTGMKPGSSHKQRFEIINVKDGNAVVLSVFFKPVSEEFVSVNFATPFRIPSKTKLLISCDKKIESMASITMSYF
ncbi:hypothetical protein DH26_gp050 [Chloriridovirus anopheles1]|uniref:Uncharacterized protein n=1 Tax=Chloriridovirus anopheles1 TaxID=1465751 RepID=W8QE32_9VIRU|nr:hypothetical protein DH26_gp050 [Anopheles minimus iridovirus]AHL67545.1 hypothetical protein AMIV_050 [Anopheles minimus iridovirus]